MTSSVVIALVLIQQSTVRYAFPLLLILGNLGNLLCIAILSQKHHRERSCSLYLVAAAVFSVIGINWGLGTNTYALYQPPDPFTLSLTLCRTRGYLLQTSSVLYRTMIVLACLDRFALTSARATFRMWSTPKTALKMIGCTTLFWLLATIHQPIFQTIEKNRCGVFGTYGLFFSIYQICVVGFILPFLMVFSGFLTWKNLKAARHRVQPAQHGNHVHRHLLSKRDSTLLKLVSVEVVVCFVITFPYPINTLYGVLVADIPNKSPDRIQVEIFINFLSLIVLYYLNYCVTFYVYAIVSKPFRREIGRFMLKCLRRPLADQPTTAGEQLAEDT